MKPMEVLHIVLREMTAYGQGWRNSWYNFDGKWLRNQLDGLEAWARTALESPEVLDYTEGTEFESSDH